MSAPSSQELEFLRRGFPPDDHSSSVGRAGHGQILCQPIVARALFLGLDGACREMSRAIREAAACG